MLKAFKIERIAEAKSQKCESAGKSVQGKAMIVFKKQVMCSI